jgi:aerobic-type carbon monoxide dehydrogenase small subunit (CoxS/CutS family)
VALSKPVAGDPTISRFAENCLTELSLFAKRLCSDARTEATTVTFEGEDGHVRVYPPAGLREEEITAIEGKLAERCVDILIEKGVFICSAVYD